MEGDRLDYLSDEELSRLICQVEDHEMLRAPAYLREETVSRMRQLSPAREHTLLPEAESAREKKRALIFYSLKVGAAAAAAIVMLFALPVREFESAQRGEPSRVSRISDQISENLGTRTNELSQKLGMVSGWLVSGDWN